MIEQIGKKTLSVLQNNKIQAFCDSRLRSGCSWKKKKGFLCFKGRLVPREIRSTPTIRTAECFWKMPPDLVGSAQQLTKSLKTVLQAGSSSQIRCHSSIDSSSRTPRQDRQQQSCWNVLPCNSAVIFFWKIPLDSVCCPATKKAPQAH